MTTGERHFRAASWQKKTPEVYLCISECANKNKTPFQTLTSFILSWHLNKTTMTLSKNKFKKIFRTPLMTPVTTLFCTIFNEKFLISLKLQQIVLRNPWINAFNAFNSGLIHMNCTFKNQEILIKPVYLLQNYWNNNYSTISYLQCILKPLTHYKTITELMSVAHGNIHSSKANNKNQTSISIYVYMYCYEFHLSDAFFIFIIRVISTSYTITPLIQN